MNKYGLLGNDISYSKSVVLHNIIKDIYQLNYSYELIDIKEEQLDDYLESFYRGFSVTKPFKEIVLNKIDKKSKIVKNVNAVNSIYRKNNKLYGDNTDYYGFRYLIKYYNIDIKNKKIAILGTGGAAKVVYYFLKKHSKEVYFVSRSKIADNIISYDVYSKYHFDIIVNATPIGTSPNIDESPLTKEQVKNSIVIDLIYNPEVTKLMSYASASYNGLVMLIVQALYSHKKWHKIKINDEIILKIKERFLNV